MNMTTKLTCKPWQSYTQQVETLKRRGMIFTDTKEAEILLSHINYYRLSGYWYPFRLMLANDIRSDEFITSTRFEDVLGIYFFDKKLRLLCLRALESIEMSIRTNIAHTLGQISPLTHLNPNNFDQHFVKSTDKHGRNKKICYDKWVDKYHEQIGRAHKNPFIQHHTKKYTDIPIWVGIEVLDFGSISILYSGLKGKQQRRISMLYGIGNAKTFASWLRSLNYIRNICAHHGRLWNANIDVVARKDNNIPGLQHTDNKRLFFYLLVINNLLSYINAKSTWAHEVKELLKDFPEPDNKAINVTGLGFTNWQVW